jgi:hypothetical protein
LGGIGGKIGAVAVVEVTALTESKIEVKGIVKTIIVEEVIGVVVTVVVVLMMEGITEMIVDNTDEGIMIEDIAPQVAAEALLVIEVEALGEKVVLKGEQRLSSGIENVRRNNHQPTTMRMTMDTRCVNFKGLNV